MEQESNEQEPNEATEIVGGKVETVEVSKHPEASIPETDLSLADIERRRSHPLRWVLIIRRFILHSKNTLKDLEPILSVGASLLLHCLAHIKHSLH